jgi:hypothetical protein
MTPLRHPHLRLALLVFIISQPTHAPSTPAAAPAAPEDTYDHFVHHQHQAQIHLTQNAWTAAIPPLENILALDAAHTARAPRAPAWLTPAQRHDIHRTLAQLQAHHATHLYALATADPAAPDKTLLEKTLAAAERGLTLTAPPDEQLLNILHATHQQLGHPHAAAETLERLVATAPANKNYWSQLAAAWLNTAAAATANEPDRPTAARSANLRAIHAIERAQKHGALDTPKDNHNLVALYLNLGSPEHAITLLEAGLRDGRIETTRRNYELLAAAWLNIERPDRALETYTAAAARFPKEGQLDLQASQLLYSAGHPEKALVAARTGLAKGFVEKPGLAHTWIAFLAYELARYDEAGKAADLAATFPDARPEELARLKTAITEKAEGLKN